MIDMHCHIVFGFDDGPESLEAAVEMLDMAYRDGIRTIVATSHRNHILDFENTQSYEESLEMVINAATEKYSDLKIFKGAELYIDSDYLKIIDSNPYDFTINGTGYVLIEFPRDVAGSYMLEVAHEFKVRGYTPIIAHIEMYPKLIEDDGAIKLLKDEGIYLQITGSSLIGKQGKEIKGRLRKLVKKGHIDFIASDGHSAIRRRPLLSKAYELVARDCSTELADRIFKENPWKIIAGENLSRLTLEEKKKKSFRLSLNVVASVAAVFLVVIFGAFTLGFRDDMAIGIDSGMGGESSKAEKAKNGSDSEPLGFISRILNLDGNSEVEETLKANGDEKVSDVGEGDADIVSEKSESDEKSETVDKPKSDDKNEASASETSNKASSLEEKSETVNKTKSKAEIESEYRSKLNGLASQYQGSVSSAVSNIKSASSIEDPSLRASTIEKYAGQISGVESSADNSVYGLLYDMQNELEANGYDTSTVESFRSEYNQTKESTKSQYLNQ